MVKPASEIVKEPTRRRTPLRFVTAASLFDGHDAAINIIRRLIQAQGAEVIHLGHNRSVADIVNAAIQEDADAIACSSYQGGHNEYYRYMVDMLRERDADHIRLVVGGGGTISPDEIVALEEYGVEKIYSPADGLRLGLSGMIEDVFERVNAWPRRPMRVRSDSDCQDYQAIACMLSALEETHSSERLAGWRHDWDTSRHRAPVMGVTGTGGAGKSSLTDELLSRFVRQYPQLQIAVVAMDPTRRRSGGALLGDRIRMNSLSSDRIYMRSLATRRAHLATSAVLADSIAFLRQCGFGLVIVETAGIGQSDSEIVDMVDLSVYVMTSDYGAASQLEKIEMLDFADMIVLNKYEKRGAQDALRDIRKQWQRNHMAFDKDNEEAPVYPTIASQFNDAGVNYLYNAICNALDRSEQAGNWDGLIRESRVVSPRKAIIPAERTTYLAEIARGGRELAADVEKRASAASNAHACYRALSLLPDESLPEPFDSYAEAHLDVSDTTLAALRRNYNDSLASAGAEALQLLRGWPSRRDAVRTEQYSFEVRGREITGENYSESLSGTQIPKIAAPQAGDWGDQLRFLMTENLPGGFPFTAGVYPYRREQEDPIRQFAGEGTPERTNRRFHYLAAGHASTRLSTAFDSATLYGEDPDRRPDIYGRIGNSGVSIATLDDMKKLYSGFDLCDPSTSVSMTINGPAPMILAMFLNTAVDQQVERYLRENGRWEKARQKIDALYQDHPRPCYAGDLPDGHDGFGLGLLGVTGDRLLEPEIYEQIRADTLSTVRGTVQADILKEDQAQNTCIFSTEFALRMMGDIQAYFIEKRVRNFYSVSISGYHIAEAGANPITQLAFTLANGFTIVEYYLSRGMALDDFAPNLSFFFSNGMDPEYAVIGRVARRIWARAMRDIYGGGPRSQMLKYHIQTSGRSLHAKEIQFNDIRTTLQALYALFDNCNSLHTNAYDEAITTPTEESVRRAVAIQLIINKELGLNRNQNSLQGSYIIDELTDLVEEAIYKEFDRISERGGVLGAMESMYQRGRIQEESLYYESRKHDGRLPIVGVNTFLGDDGAEDIAQAELIRSTEKEKQQQVQNTADFWQHNSVAGAAALQQLREAAAGSGNVFARLMEAVKCCSLGRISNSLYEVGGRYRRNM